MFRHGDNLPDPMFRTSVPMLVYAPDAVVFPFRLVAYLHLHLLEDAFLEQMISCRLVPGMGQFGLVADRLESGSSAERVDQVQRVQEGGLVFLLGLRFGVELPARAVGPLPLEGVVRRRDG